MEDQLIGRKLGEFIIKQRLGEGGFGAVYTAKQPLLAREIIVKVIHDKHTQNPRYVERFIREARLASRLEHPYTASIYAFGAEPDGLLWIAMEYVRGVTLGNLLKAQGSLPLERFVPLLEKICEVVQTAHDSKIIHRDLKPANIMVIARAGTLFPKLLDFGIAKSLDGVNRQNDPDPSPPQADSPPKNANGNLTVTWEDRPPERVKRDIDTNLTRGTMGSPPFMAPELWKDASIATERTDIYALGVITYLCLTGQQPFHGDVRELLKAHIKNPVPSLGSKFSSALDRVIAKAMAKKPEERYASAVEFAAAVREAAGMAERPTPLHRLDERLRESLLATAPEPIAEAVALLETARNPYQAREQILEIVRTVIRYLGVIALAARRSFSKANSDRCIELLHKLRKESLVDEEWLELARELLRPFALKPDLHPIPELVKLFFEQTSEAEPFTPLLEFFKNRFASDTHLHKQLEAIMPALSQLLNRISFLSSYKLVLAQAGHSELWMGNHLRSNFLEIKGETEQIYLTDPEGNLLLSLWPFALAREPTSGARKELFLLEGNSRNGAKLTAFPSGFEHKSEELWSYFDADFFGIEDKSFKEEQLEQAPYLGLNSFSPENSGIFFGREKETENLLNRLKTLPLLALVGSSGAGKSSLIQAGIVPGLAANTRAITVRPGSSPLSTLTSKLKKEGIAVEDLHVELESDIKSLGRVLRLEAERAEIHLVLIIDQFEEVFTLCTDPAERELFARGLAQAARSAEEPVRLILNLRDDFLVRARELPELGQKILQGIEILTTPAFDDLIRILVEPARRAGYHFEDARMPIEMVSQVAGRPGALPLLAFTAAKLWEKRDVEQKRLSRETFLSLGGVGGALASHAEEMFRMMSQKEQRIVQEAFRRLVTNEGTRAVLSISELEQVLGGSEEAKIVLEKLTSARLLSTFEGEGGVERIEVVHEALFTAWPRLVNWRQEEAEGVRLRDQLSQAARQWDERGRPKGLLWRDEALAEMKLWQARYQGRLTEREEAFSKASLTDDSRRRFRRSFFIAGAFALLLAGLVSFYQINRKMQEQLLDSYEEQGRQELLNGDSMRAALYFNEVYKERSQSPSLRLMLSEAMRAVDVEVTHLSGHSEGVNRAIFSPDGRYVATASDDHTAKIWDSATGSLLLTLNGHSDEVLDLGYSHDGTRLVTVGRDISGRVWDTKSRQLLLTLKGRKARLVGASFTADDKLIVTTGFNGEASVWDAETGRLLYEIPDSSITYALPSPDNTRLLLVYEKNARIVDITGQNTYATLQEHHTSLIRRAAFSPDGKHVVTASYDSTAKLWNAADGRLVASLEGHKGDVTNAFYSPDGQIVATCSADRTIKLWSAANGRLLASLEGHQSIVWSVDFSPDGKRLLSASYDKSVRIWNIDSIVNRVKTIEVDGLTHADLSSDGKLFAAASSQSLKIFQAASMQELRSIPFSKPFAMSFVCFSPDGRQVATASIAEKGNESTAYEAFNKELVARVWDVQTGQLLLTLTGHSGDIDYLAFSPDGTRIATASYDNTARVWDTRTGNCVFTLKGHGKSVEFLSFSPDNKYLATASMDGKAVIWNFHTGQQIQALSDGASRVGCAAFSPDSKYLVTGHNNSTAKIWDIATGKIILSLDGHTGDIRSIAFSSDGKLIASASGDYTAKIWDSVSGKCLLTLEGYNGWLNSVEFSPDDSHLYTSSLDGTIKIWDIRQETRSPAEVSRIISQRVPMTFDRGQIISISPQAVSSQK